MQRRKKEGVGETRIMMPGEFIETHKRALWHIQRKPCHKTLFIMPQLASLKGENTVKVSLPGPVAFSCCLRLTLCGIGCLSPANASLISDLLIFTFSVCVLFLPSIWVLFSFDCNFYFHILPCLHLFPCLHVPLPHSPWTFPFLSSWCESSPLVLEVARTALWLQVCGALPSLWQTLISQLTRINFLLSNKQIIICSWKSAALQASSNDY